MDILFKIFLMLHIAGGTIGLLTGTINLFRIKGDRFHRRIGIVFMYSMLTAGFSSLVLSAIHPNYFLFMIGVFTLYMISTGKRYINLRLSDGTQKASRVDWGITVMMLAAALLFISIGIKFIVKQNFFGTVFIVFGSLGLSMVKRDFANYNGRSRAKNYWLLAHLQRMTGAYIASLTAFLVVNAKYFPDYLPAVFFWLLPTAILVPLIIRWSRKYEVRKKAVPNQRLN
jgi:uncharacterized membrane protein